MTHREAVDLSAVLHEMLGVPGIWRAVCEGGHEDLIRGAAQRLTDCVSAHWEENGCTFNGGRDGMTFPETCEAARRPA